MQFHLSTFALVFLFALVYAEKAAAPPLTTPATVIARGEDSFCSTGKDCKREVAGRHLPTPA